MRRMKKTTRHASHWARYGAMATGFCAVVSMEVAVPGSLSPVALAATTSANSASAVVDSLLGPLAESGAFSGSVLIAKRGHILVDNSYGFANRFQNINDTPQTRFAIGALTQSFIAVAVMQLAEEGKLKLSDPVSKFISTSNQSAQQITVRDLLTQTSGAPGSPNAPATVPGTGFTYSPLNYLLLGNIIQAVTGETCQAYVQQHILTPLNLTNTGFITSSMSKVDNGATGYDDSGSTINAVDFSPGQFVNAMGMYSTAEDLYKWDQALYTSELISLSDVKQIFTADPITVKSLGTLGYGFGWTLTPDNQVAVEQSVDSGFDSFIDRDLQNDTTVIILANDDYSPMRSIEGTLESIVSQAPISTGSTPHSTGSGEKNIDVDHHYLLTVDGRAANGTTYLPLWYIGRALQALNVKMGWNGTRRVLTFTSNTPIAPDTIVSSLGLGNTDVYLNGQLIGRINTYIWPDPATHNRTYASYAPIYNIGVILRAVGIQTSWNGKTWSLQGN